MKILRKMMVGFLGGSISTALFIIHCWDKHSLFFVLTCGGIGAVLNYTDLLRGEMNDH